MTKTQCTDYTNAIAYYRVSTMRQGESGLGLDSQKSSVETYASRNGYTLINSYTEIETGTSKRKRVEIYKAIEQAKENNAVLLIAKLDRLARNVAFVSSLKDSGVCFVAVDMPNANDLTIHIMSAMAQHEAKMISDRTKSALVEAKKRGVKLGNPQNATDEGRAKGGESTKQKSKDAYKVVSQLIVQYRDDKGMSWQAVANELNANDIKTRNGKEFKAMTARRIYLRTKG